MVSMSTNELWTLHNTDIRKPIEKYKSTGKSIVFTWFHSESKDIKKIDSKAGDICFIRGLLWVQGHLHEKANSVNEGKIAYKNDHKLFCSRSIPFKGSNAPLSIKCVYILYIYIRIWTWIQAASIHVSDTSNVQPTGLVHSWIAMDVAKHIWR